VEIIHIVADPGNSIIGKDVETLISSVGFNTRSSKIRHPVRVITQSKSLSLFPRDKIKVVLPDILQRAQKLNIQQRKRNFKINLNRAGEVT
jgi:ABC-type antimicrobial peptide transport system ATPase subunit